MPLFVLEDTLLMFLEKRGYYRRRGRLSGTFGFSSSDQKVGKIIFPSMQVIEGEEKALGCSK